MNTRNNLWVPLIEALVFIGGLLVSGATLLVLGELLSGGAP